MALSTGQSGAGMVPMHLGVISARRRPISDRARHILRLRSFLEVMLFEPQRSPRADARLFELDQVLRIEAAQYIADACTDLDRLGFIQREAAAGRRHVVESSS